MPRLNEGQNGFNGVKLMIDDSIFATGAVKFKLCRLRRACIHRRDAKDAEINDFLFAVERTAKRNCAI